uniref:Uncharacterized protein n=1 Tax=Siphoviridae sp. ctuvC1 TaxID=2826507 RepID=A0A8S5LZT1_9CAUD|nr:MAG TPA: hypothetical protein [Siphoviridae sp. ctuvC1]DAR24693.1 MAG TPA: hypothetical protein [Caudoviricetes sp.]
MKGWLQFLFILLSKTLKRAEHSRANGRRLSFRLFASTSPGSFTERLAGRGSIIAE